MCILFVIPLFRRSKIKYICIYEESIDVHYFGSFPSRFQVLCRFANISCAGGREAQRNVYIWRWEASEAEMREFQHGKVRFKYSS